MYSDQQRLSITPSCYKFTKLQICFYEKIIDPKVFHYSSNDDNLGLKLTITTHLNTLTQFTFGASLKLKRPMVNFTELLRNGPKSGHITAN